MTRIPPITAGGLPPTPSAPGTSGTAIASLALGIVGIPTCCCPIAPVLALALGAVALGSINRGEAVGKGIAISGIVLGIIGLLISIGCWTASFLTIPAEVIPGDELSEQNVSVLQAAGVLADDETVQLFYPTASFELTASGTILGNRRIITFSSHDDVDAMDFADIANIQVATGNNTVAVQSQFRLESDDDYQLVFDIMANGEDVKFFNALKRSVDEARSAAGKPPVEVEQD